MLGFFLTGRQYQLQKKPARSCDKRAGLYGERGGTNGTKLAVRRRSAKTFVRSLVEMFHGGFFFSETRAVSTAHKCSMTAMECNCTDFIRKLDKCQQVTNLNGPADLRVTVLNSDNVIVHEFVF